MGVGKPSAIIKTIPLQSHKFLVRFKTIVLSRRVHIKFILDMINMMTDILRKNMGHGFFFTQLLNRSSSIRSGGL